MALEGVSKSASTVKDFLSEGVTASSDGSTQFRLLAGFHHGGIWESRLTEEVLPSTPAVMVEDNMDLAIDY